ncbi:hypothetical protein Tb927.6.2530 [Trypanosoma brucei brucei TREU927]|uniref:T. brucei spp.-specific protein n=1 Tax=Trypanosoma brucei brucei (strain 927/4 GUTat10.1) TaxID=185431 RepID=Q584Q3_TRYB2|nr:hypothetical protein Tb927.6.2530 [Trypanosoma brucei brucei TREU927]AAX80885.1 hypothetical protein Tb927.6.2530 [Trypanosoma brucei]AAZ11815.1 hypothetical protein Tb927.6.2530 [Trypanosoma brucei brucei TREU927]
MRLGRGVVSFSFFFIYLGAHGAGCSSALRLSCIYPSYQQSDIDAVFFSCDFVCHNHFLFSFKLFSSFFFLVGSPASLDFVPFCEITLFFFYSAFIISAYNSKKKQHAHTHVHTHMRQFIRLSFSLFTLSRRKFLFFFFFSSFFLFDFIKIYLYIYIFIYFFSFSFSLPISLRSACESTLLEWGFHVPIIVCVCMTHSSTSLCFYCFCYIFRPLHIN